MIMLQTVQWTAEKILKEAFIKPTHQPILRSLMHRDRWPHFIKALHERVNQLDIAGYVKSREALDIFIKQAVVYYSLRIVDKIEKQMDHEGDHKPA
jgi:hypothetical protein